MEMETSKRKKLKTNPSLQLLEFQKEGVQHILRGFCSDTYSITSTTRATPHVKHTHAFLLFDEMGMGKTVQSLEAMRQMLPHLHHPMMVVGPASCIHVWRDEVQTHFTGVFEVRLFIGKTAISSTLQGLTPRTIVLTSYDTLRNAYQGYISKALALGQLNNVELYRFCQVYVHYKQHDTLQHIVHQGIHHPNTRSNLLKLARQVRLKFKVANHNKYNVYQQLVRQQYSIVVMDEAHKLKNSQSNTTKAVGCILSHFRLALTGTPVMNNGKELLSIMRFGLNLFEADWREIYKNPDGEYCRALCKKIMMGRKKTEVPELQSVLPTRRRELERVCLKWDMFPSATQAYVNVKQDSVQMYEKTNLLRRNTGETKESFLLRRARAAHTFWSKFQKLRQICLHPDLPHFQRHAHYAPQFPNRVTFTPWTAFLFPKAVKQSCIPFLLALKRCAPDIYNNGTLRSTMCHWVIQSQRYIIEPSAKMLAFYRIYLQTQRRHTSTNGTIPKVVAFSHFRTFLEHILYPWLQQKGIPCVIFTGGSRKKQEEALRLFRNQEDIRVLLIVKSAGAHGLNLQDTASTCVLFDPHFNEALDEQAVQRVDRIGQISDEVVIRKLYMEGSVDEVLYRMQERKINRNNAWLGRNNNKLTLEEVGMFLSKYDRVGNE